VYEKRDSIEVICGDAFDVMPNFAEDPSVGCFADPVYNADPSSKGMTLYRYHEVSHPRLFSMLAGWHGPWLMSQDMSLTVRRLVRRHRLEAKAVRMKTGGNVFKHELVIWTKRPLF
jgi:hypothetical protein